QLQKGAAGLGRVARKAGTVGEHQQVVRCRAIDDGFEPLLLRQGVGIGVLTSFRELLPSDGSQPARSRCSLRLHVCWGSSVSRRRSRWSRGLGNAVTRRRLARMLETRPCADWLSALREPRAEHPNLAFSHRNREALELVVEDHLKASTRDRDSCGARRDREVRVSPALDIELEPTSLEPHFGPLLL